MTEEIFICTSCGEELPITQRLEFDDQDLCQHCLDEETVICSDCGERIWNDDNAGSDDRSLCQSCYDRHYTSCIRCGALLRVEDARYDADDEDEEEPLCENCYARTARIKAIQDYYYKPEPIFYGEGLASLGSS